MQFKLNLPYKLAGDQPQAVEKLSTAIEPNNSKALLIGVTGSGKTLTMAGVVNEVQRPVLVITHNKTLAAQLYREFKEFFPENAVEYFISYYDYYQPEAYVPSSDTYIEKDSSINDEIEMLRLRATSSLLERNDVIVIASVSCIYGLGSPEDFENSVLFIKRDDVIKREEILGKLIHMQYTRNDFDFGRGNFRVRGDVIEVLPAYADDALRFEFFGDELEAIIKVDRLTGKSKEQIDQTAIYPAKQFITSPPKLESAIIKIREELNDQIEFFKKNDKPLEAERIRQRTIYDLEMLKEMGHCNGIENYSRHLTDRAEGTRPACLIDYFRNDFLVIIDESHVTIPQIGGMFAGDRSRKQTLVDFGFRLPSALDNRPLNFEEFSNLAKNILYVSATPADFEMNDSANNHVEQIIRPTGLLDPVVDVRKTHRQVDDLAREVTERAEKDERTFITTLTKRMAEDLSEYYLDLGMKVRYMHSDIDAIERVEILRDLRKGEFDALIGINLLREGLDLPEVSLVAILDADKEGFLRNKRSLIQTMGRAARNANGKVILYADKMTDSMKGAISETQRRRSIQEQHNEKHGITPQTIQKEIKDIIERTYQEDKTKSEALNKVADEFGKDKYKSKKEWMSETKKAMLEAAENLDFEKAAMLRDLLFNS